MNGPQKEPVLSLFARKSQQVIPLNSESKPLSSENTPIAQVQEEINDKDQKLTVKQKRTFLISSIQPTIKARDIFKKALQKKKELDQAKEKPKNVIKMSIVYIEKFIRLMKQQSTVIRFRQGGQSQLDIINDKSADYRYYLVNNYFEKEKFAICNKFLLLMIKYYFSNLQQRNHLYFYRSQKNFKKLHYIFGQKRMWSAGQSQMKQNILFFQQLLNNSYQIQINFPFKFKNSKFYMIWSIFLLVVLSINVLYVPVAISFKDIQLSTFAEVLIDIIPNACFMVEIIVKFNTAIYQKGLIIKSRKKIVLTYMQKRFWYDLLIVFCFFVGSYVQNAYIQTILLLRYFDIARLLGDLEDRYNLRERFYGIMDLIKLILFILFIAHLCGCIWHYIAVIEISQGNYITWIGNGDKVLDINWKERYVDSLYFSVVTMCTLGYGDIVPVTSEYKVDFILFFFKAEKLFTIGVTLISCFVFGYSVNQIGDILKEFLRIEEEFKVKMAKLNMYMKKRELNDDVTVKVRKYFEYLHKEELQSNIEGASLIDSLETDLKSEVLKDIYGKLLRSKKLFKLNFDVDSLSVKIKEKTVGLHEYIYKEGDDSNCIFFLLKGQVEVIKTQTNTVLQKLEKGMMFGEIEFFTGQMRQYAIRSNSVAQIAYFNKEDFFQVLKNRKPDYEKFKKMQDLLYVYQDTQGLDHQCGSCGKYTHLLMHCPQINVVLNKQKTLTIYNFQVNQERKKDFKRMRNRYVCWLSKIGLVQQLANTFYENEKLQLLELYEEDEEDALMNSNTNLMPNKSPNDDKKLSWNQFGEQHPRKKSQVQFQHQNEGQTRERNESNSGVPRRKSRLSMIQQGRGRKISRVEKENPSSTTPQSQYTNTHLTAQTQTQMHQQTQDKKHSLVQRSANQLAPKQQEKQPEKTKTDNKIRKSFLDDDFAEQSNFDSHMTIGELLSKNKKRGLMPSFFDSKKLFSPKILSEESKKNSKIKFINDSSQNTENQGQFTELNDLQPKLRNKSSISITSDSSSDEFSSSDNNKGGSVPLNKEKSQSSKNKINKINPENFKSSIPSLNQQDIINKLMNGGDSIENIMQENSLNQNQDSNQITRDNSQSDSQKVLFLLGFQNDQQKVDDQIGDEQKQTSKQEINIVQQLITNTLNQFEDDFNKANLSANEFNREQRSHSKHSSRISIKDKLRSQQNDRKSMLAVEEHNQGQNSRTSISQQQSVNPKKKSFLGNNSPQISNKRHSNHNQNMSVPNIVIQPTPNQPRTSHLNQMINFDQSKQLNNKGIQDVRRKVSILVTRNGTQDVPINVTLSVNQKEQDQLREILEIEQNMMHGSMLKKTLPRKLNSRLRTKSHELLEKVEKKQIEMSKKNEISEYKYEEVDGEEEDDDHQIKKDGYMYNIPSLNNLDSASYQLQLDKQFSASQMNNQRDEYDDDEDYYDFSDQLEFRKYEQIYLKKYDDEFISQFEKIKEFKEYFPKNNFSNVLEMISIRRKLNPFYRVLLLRKKAKNAKNARPLNRMHNYRKSMKNLNLMSKSFFGSSFLKQSFSVNTTKGLSPLNN